MSGSTAQDPSWKSREQSEENRYIYEKEQAQLAAIRAASTGKATTQSEPSSRRDDIEGGFGGQEDLEDRYATTSGEH
ncbi:hypothetical protein BOTBODRAFT_34882 [Botryobasidium botryosum FD-172 SS1]|uniref:Uncharacterized protein n=1 Tax=Botryobasidium botryosum (strain FD-172 SS1) TaxID=930990 RepID=A0A067M8B5_BOTB1|nr:hypothetical protein BOTBODRAFT_34882 [Botryobasidium botryosum FD-172 SS1]